MGPPGVGAVEPEAKGQQDLQHAVDLYQKGMGIAHGATTFEDHCRAIESFSLAIAIRPTQARFFLARGNAFRAIGELERAAKDYGSALALDDRSALYYANRGACYRKLNQTAKALEDLTNAIELDGRKAPHYFNRALVLHDAGFYREAIVDFSKALEDGSTAAAANAGAGSSGGSGTTATPPANGGGIGIRVEYRALQTHFSYALELLEGFEESSANTHQILGLRYLRGESALRLGRFQDAVDDCSAAIAGGYTADMAAHNARGMALRGLGDYDRALRDLNACVTQEPKNDTFRFHRALCLMECMRYYEALPDLHETATRNSSDTKLLYYIGLCYYHEHQPSECVVFMKRALQCTPPQELLPDLYYHMGLSYALEGQNMDAVEHFTSAYDHSLLVGTSIEVGNNQEDELHDAGDKQNQLQQLHEAQLLYIHERAKALQLERYHAEALADFSFVITQQPTNAHAYFRRGFAHKALGDFNAAAHDLQTARLLDPNNLQLVVNYKELRDVECIVLCAPGEEKRF
ncbi:hypothetical protein PF003_g4521 [Phytophthora fragariae]|nr:hypothetical protein PF003_g4521 [Phytophthora fragariae]